MRKHASEIHPGTGTDQSVHAPKNQGEGDQALPPTREQRALIVAGQVEMAFSLTADGLDHHDIGHKERAKAKDKVVQDITNRLVEDLSPDELFELAAAAAELRASEWGSARYPRPPLEVSSSQDIILKWPGWEITSDEGQVYTVDNLQNLLGEFVADAHLLKKSKVLLDAVKKGGPEGEAALDEILFEKVGLSRDPKQWPISAQYHDEFRETARLYLDGTLRRNPDRYDVIRNAVDMVLGSWANTAADHDVMAVALQEAVAREFGMKKPDWSYLGPKDRAVDLGGNSFFPQVEEINQQFGAAFQTIFRGMYNNTQAQLDAQGFGDTVYLFRGVRFKEGDVKTVTADLASVLRSGMDQLGRDTSINPRTGVGRSLDLNKQAITWEATIANGNPAQSWTPDWETASQFSGSASTWHGSVVLVASVPRERVLATARTGMGALHEYEWVVMNDPNAPVRVVPAYQPAFGWSAFNYHLMDRVSDHGINEFDARAAINWKRAKDVATDSPISFDSLAALTEMVNYGTAPGYVSLLGDFLSGKIDGADFEDRVLDIEYGP